MASRWPLRRSQATSEPRTAVVDLPEGASSLLIRVAGGRTSGPASLVTTFVADQPGRIQREAISRIWSRSQ